MNLTIVFRIRNNFYEIGRMSVPFVFFLKREFQSLLFTEECRLICKHFLVYPRYLATMGIRLPTPKALEDTLSMGGV